MLCVSRSIGPYGYSEAVLLRHGSRASGFHAVFIPVGCGIARRVRGGGAVFAMTRVVARKHSEDYEQDASYE